MNDNPTRTEEPRSPVRREVLQLFPPPVRRHLLAGLYLNERLPNPASGAPALAYANFLTSLDGRIAVTDADGASRLPPGLTNAGDWRLFRELQAHADCLVTHGGYLRALARGRLGNVMQVGLGDDADDIVQWRAAQGMTVQPAVAIVSDTLDLPIPDSLAAHGQPVHVLTTDAAPRDRRALLGDAGFDLVVTGAGPGVRGRDVVEVLARRGYRRLYLQTGPRMLASALRDRVLARVYVTIGHRLMGGTRFDTMVHGGLLGNAGLVRLSSLYLHETASRDRGQLFASFDAL